MGCSYRTSLSNASGDTGFASWPAATRPSALLSLPFDTAALEFTGCGVGCSNRQEPLGLKLKQCGYDNLMVQESYVI
jgi:hypothetical protein